MRAKLRSSTLLASTYFPESGSVYPSFIALRDCASSASSAFSFACASAEAPQQCNKQANTDKVPICVQRKQLCRRMDSGTQCCHLPEQ